MSHLTDEYWNQYKEDLKLFAHYFQEGFPEPGIEMKGTFNKYKSNYYADMGLLIKEQLLSHFKRTFGSKFAEVDMEGKQIAYLNSPNNNQLWFAAVFEIFIIGEQVIAYVFFIATMHDQRHKGLAREFIADLSQGARQVATLYKCKSAIVVAMTSNVYKKFYQKRGFVVAPTVVQTHWAEDKMTIMMRYGEAMAVQQCTEDRILHPEQKKRDQKQGRKTLAQDTKQQRKQQQQQQNQQQQKQQSQQQQHQMIDDSVSTITTNLHGSRSGIAHDKHCATDTCKACFIKGSNWSRHKKQVHPTLNDVPFEVCDGIRCKACEALTKQSTKPLYECSQCMVSKRSDLFKQYKDYKSLERVCDKCLSPKKERKSTLNKHEEEKMQVVSNSILNKRIHPQTTTSTLNHLDEGTWGDIDNDQYRDTSSISAGVIVQQPVLIQQQPTTLTKQIEELKQMLQQQQQIIATQQAVHAQFVQQQQQQHIEQLKWQQSQQQQQQQQQQEQQQQQQQNNIQPSIIKDDVKSDNDKSDNDNNDDNNDDDNNDDDINDDDINDDDNNDDDNNDGDDNDGDDNNDDDADGNEQRKYGSDKIELFRVVQFSDLQVINIIKALEDNKQQDIVMGAFEIKPVCDMFVQGLVSEFIGDQQHPTFEKCLIELLKWSDQLTADQKIGLLAASFRIGESLWTHAINMLKTTIGAQRNFVLNVFAAFLKQFQVSDCVTDWIKKNWEHFEQQQLKLLHAHIFNKNKIVVNEFGLTLSRIVKIEDILDGKFQTMASKIEESKISKLLVDAIENQMTQPLVDFTTFVKLMSYIHDVQQSKAINAIQDQLAQIPISRWQVAIEQAKKAAGIADVESIQMFLNQLNKAFGPVKHLNKDLTLSDDDRFSMFLQIVDNAPNNRQFAAAQCCMAIMYTQPRQLWNVPSGQGKGRIEHTLAIIALLLGVYSKVHLVYDNQQLLDRDKNDFCTYLDLLDEQTQIEYHMGYQFEVKDSELVIVDEADTFIYANPETFRDFIAKTACVCFTATPGEDDNNSTDSKVLSALQIKRYHYMVDEKQKQFAFSFEMELAAATTTDKATIIKEQSSKGPVLVYCGDTLKEELTNMNLPVIVVDDKVDHTQLRQLSIPAADNQYHVVIGTTMFAMRGIDYRSTDVPMTLYVAQSFDNKREAIQGYKRVGRYTDNCVRVIFKDVQLINAEAERKQRVQAFKFVSSMQKKQVLMKPVNVKQIVVPNQKQQPIQQQGKQFNTSLSNSRVIALLKNGSFKQSVEWERSFKEEDQDTGDNKDMQ